MFVFPTIFLFRFQIIPKHKIQTFCWIRNAALSSVVVKSPRCSQGVHRVISLTHRWWPTRSDMDSTYLGRGPWYAHYAPVWYFWSFLNQAVLRNFPAHMSWRSIHELTCGRISTHIRAPQSDKKMHIQKRKLANGYSPNHCLMFCSFRLKKIFTLRWLLQWSFFKRTNRWFQRVIKNSIQKKTEITWESSKKIFPFPPKKNNSS